MSLPADPTARLAGLMLLVARRFPWRGGVLTAECAGCGRSAGAPLAEDATAGALLDAAGRLPHECPTADLVVRLAGADDGWLRWTAGGAAGTVVEPARERRWAGDDGARLLELAAATLRTTDPAVPLTEVPLTEVPLTGVPPAGEPPAGEPLPEPPAGTVHGAFRAQAERTPDAAAVRTIAGETTYAQLVDQADRVAWVLRDAPAGPVAVDLDPGPAEVAALLGILAAGRAYLALDRKSPPARIARMLTAAGPAALLNHRGGPAAVPPSLPILHIEDLAATPAAGPVDWSGGGPGDPACVMFTSGSTGEPKGMRIAHESILRLVRSEILPAPLKRGRFLRSAPLAFDASTFELWTPLLHGGAVVPIEAAAGDTDALAAAVHRHAVDVLWLTTGLFHHLADASPRTCAAAPWVFVGGEVTRPDAVAAVLAEGTGCTVVHCYGPTENTTFSTTWPVRSAASATARHRMPIGRAIDGDQLLVLDPAGRPVPPGLAGELTTAGYGVALGYLGADPSGGGRLGRRTVAGRTLRSYRTGDHVTRLADGSLEFLGRVDDQVKTRGYRIEFAEVEAAICRLPGALAAAVTLDRSAGADTAVLYAAAVLAPDAPPPAAILAALRDTLPEYMVPDRLVAVARLPLTANGKVDRAAVAAAARAPGRIASDPVRTAVEQVLGSADFGDDDDLLNHGLHSLRALHLLRALRDLTPAVTLRDMLINATVARLRELVGQASAAGQAR